MVQLGHCGQHHVPRFRQQAQPTAVISDPLGPLATQSLCVRGLMQLWAVVVVQLVWSGSAPFDCISLSKSYVDTVPAFQRLKLLIFNNCNSLHVIAVHASLLTWRWQVNSMPVVLASLLVRRKKLWTLHTLVCVGPTLWVAGSRAFDKVQLDNGRLIPSATYATLHRSDLIAHTCSSTYA